MHGPRFIYTASPSCLENMIKWLIMVQIASKSDKKNAIRALKTLKLILLVLKANFATATQEQAQFLMLFMSKR